MANKVWFITGASKGFGMELAKAALETGDRVVATARNPKTIEDTFGAQERLLVLKLDVTNEQQAKEAVNAALKQFGHIDILVNNAGRGLVGAVEEVTVEEVRAAFAVNVEGTLNVSRAALPSMRARKSGHILNLSSVGGFVSWPGWGHLLRDQVHGRRLQRSHARRTQTARHQSHHRRTGTVPYRFPGCFVAGAHQERYQ